MQKSKAFCKSEGVCTLAIFFRMLPDCALLVAANRDEHYDRPSAPPAELATIPRIVAGRDLRAGGTWLGVNEHGLLAAMLNRRINNDSAAAAGRRSRGHLCLDLLAHRSAADAAVWLRGHRAEYNPFTALVVDRNEARVTYNAGTKLVIEPLAPGLHVFSSAAEFDLHSKKADRAYDLFGAVGRRLLASRETPDGVVAALHGVLSDHSLPDGSADPADAICVHREVSGTVSSSIVRLDRSGSRLDLYHCPGAPCRTEFHAALKLNAS